MSEITNASLAAQVSALLNKWHVREDQYKDWITGTATGGTLEDGTGTGGYYPLTDKESITYYLPSPAALGDSVTGVVNSALSYKDLAEAARDAAIVAQAASEAAVPLSVAAKDAAIFAQGLAETAYSQAANEKSNAQTARIAAESAEINAATSEANATTSETNAAASESNASTSESNAAASESNALNYRNAAEGFKDSAAGSATSASASKIAAETAEINATGSASNASTSEANASISETNAANSATNASTSVSNASASETDAAGSASAAAASASNASTSASAAATSESNASNSEDKAEKWADEAEDTEVETGKYSAKHWAAKSAATASAVTSVDGKTGGVDLSGDYHSKAGNLTVNGDILTSGSTYMDNGTTGSPFHILRDSVGGVRHATTDGNYFIQQVSTAGVYEGQLIECRRDAEVKLYYDAALKANTRSDGFGVTGIVVASDDIHSNGSAYYGDGKEALRYSDNFLRLNPTNAFTSGIFCGTGILRTDGTFQVGASGSKFSVNGANGNTTITGSLTVSNVASALAVNATGAVTGGTTSQFFPAFVGNIGSANDANYRTALRLHNVVGTYVGGLVCNSTSTDIASSSDYRLKENIVPLEGQSLIDRIDEINPVEYCWKSETTEDHDLHGKSIGYIAHELQDVYPRAVMGEKDAVDEDDNPVYQTVSTAAVSPLAMAGVKELLKMVRELTTEVATLTDRIDTLENL